MSQFRFRLKNSHLLPANELSRRITIELAYMAKADSIAEKRVLQALDDYSVLTFDLLLLVTQLSESALGTALEELKFKQLVEW
ncbi:MAG: hypothetical protein ACREAY_00250 [Nitrososphaera sp.]|uniref:hypothetical protein n=1 Tax=Nitrososphaera sp. TaxID=1971748 RepID=UPI003D6F1D18